MSIKEKLEKAKEKVKRRVRKAAVGAALVGTLGAGAVSCGEENVKDKQDNAKTETSAKTEARETPAWMGEPVSPAWGRPHGDSENKSESSKKANKKILDKIAKQKRER